MGELEGKRICIDTTGFMRYVLISLVASLYYRKLKKFTALYSEPLFYQKQGDTLFSTASSGTPRNLQGIYGSNDNGDDHLIINVGYDYKLIGEVVDNKEGAAIFPIF
ncbi:hypothetical protein [Kosakonia sp. 1610]|uniref:hypothetical protein n=1 Tax=Kosakonia sp. 1610 TaxID=3156426 RepID=UPI003D24B976